MTARLLNNLGATLFPRGDLVKARKYFEESLAILEDTGDPWGRAHALRHLGMADQEEGNLEQAGERLAEALEVYRDLGDLQ